jgi:hypothetical protein
VVATALAVVMFAASASASVLSALDSTTLITMSDAADSYIVGSAVIHLNAIEPGGPGVAHTYYILDGGVQTEGLTISTSAMGDHTLTYWSVDLDGFIETPTSIDFVVTNGDPVEDLTAPTTTSDAAGSYVGSANIHLHATDDLGGSGVAHTYYILDGGATLEGTSISVSGVGGHALSYWSEDVAGNQEIATPVSFTISAPPSDLTPPTTISDASTSYVSSATIHLTAVDNAGGSGVKYTHYILDGGSGGVMVSGTVVTVSTLGGHTLEFWSSDLANNVETPHHTVSFQVLSPDPVGDVVAPVTTSDAQNSYVGTATIHLTAVDGGSGGQYTHYILDGGTQQNGILITVSTVGQHTLEFWSLDFAGNAESHSTVSFTVTAPPAVVSASAITIVTNHASIGLRKKFVLSGVLTPGKAGDHVTVWMMKPGAKTWARVTTRTAAGLTSSHGVKWSYTYSLTKKGAYKFSARFAGDAKRKSSTSRTIKVTVH